MQKYSISKLLSWKFTAIERIIIGTLVIVFTPLSCRFSIELLSVFIFLGLVLSVMLRSLLPDDSVKVLCAIYAVVFFLPMDLCLRGTSWTSLRVVPVIEEHGNLGPVKEMQAKGLVEDVSFVVYHGTSACVKVRWALLIGLKINGLHTPLLH